jgi:GT2 family glycosyltransferase
VTPLLILLDDGTIPSHDLQCVANAWSEGFDRLAIVSQDSSRAFPTPRCSVLGVVPGTLAQTINRLLDDAVASGAVLLDAALAVEPSAFEHLLRFHRPNLGMVCAKIYDRAGLIYSAGSLIVSPFGMREDLAQRGFGQSDAPAFNTPAEVDSAPPRILFLRPELLAAGIRLDPKMEAVLPFADKQAPHLLWDDFAMSARAAGFSVWNEPAATAYDARLDTHARLQEGLELKDWDARGIALWQKKWRWHPQFPSLHAIRERWGTTAIAWRIGTNLLDRWDSEQPAVDLLMVSANNLHQLRPCLEHLGRTHYPHAKLWVFLNGSRDGSAAYLRELRDSGSFPYPIEVLEAPVNLGYTPAINWLLHQSHDSGAPLVAKLDDDIVMAPDWLSRLVARLHAHPYAGAVGAKIVKAEDPSEIHWADYRLWPAGNNHQGEKDIGQFNHLVHTLANMGCCLLYRRKAIDVAGPFDISLNPVSWDDLDHQIAVRAAGYDVLFDGSVSVAHPFKALRDHCKRLAGNMRGNGTKVVFKWGLGAWFILDRGMDLAGRDIPSQPVV